MEDRDFAKEVERYFRNPLIHRVFQTLDNDQAALISNWKHLAQTYAPSGHEADRASFIADRFEEIGIAGTHVDCAGNVIGAIEGKGAGPCTAFIATMDDLTSIAERVKAGVRPVMVENNRILGPGTFITGSCASLIALAKLFSLNEIEFSGKIFFVGIAREEQNLEGMKAFVEAHEEQIDHIIDIMGGVGRMYYGAIGMTMQRVHFTGTRGHTLSGGLPNVTRAIAKAVDRIYDIPLPGGGSSKEIADFGIGRIDPCGHYLNIAMLSASDAINHRAKDGWFSVDLRSVDNAAKSAIQSKIRDIVECVANEEDLGCWIEPLNEIPAGQLEGARNSPLVRIAEEGMKLFCPNNYISDMGSTNMNVGILYGIPSIMIAGGEGGNRDTPDEYGNIGYINLGIKLHFLIGYILASGSLVQ